MYTYTVNETTVVNEDLEMCRVYGITVMQGMHVVREIYDLFCERGPAVELAALCSRLALDPDQLEDVAADAVGR